MVEETYKFIMGHYRPVEDLPGYVWLNMHNMEIISVDVLAKAILDYKAKWNKNEKSEGKIE